MKDIHEVLRRKQAQYAQLAKQIEALQAAADKLREVAPLLADGDDEGGALVLDESSDESRSMSAKATAAPASAPASKAPGRGTAPRWP
ncbi:MAG: hypothetical protein DMG68_03920 [Acidobacteria bacterium]|jgi:hypothetical protein|nr:MAG: hypothetical protein DMG68_03920 [Acidobacteriota bacterium]